MWIPKWVRDRKKGIDSPVPTQVVSNEEFTPRPQNKHQKQVEHLIDTLGTDNAKKLGMDRRAYMASSMGLATAFLASNMVYGKNWDVDFAPVASDATSDALFAVDHIAQSMPYDEMLSWLLFYTGILDLSRLPQMEIADPRGLVQSQAIVNQDQSLRVVLNGSSANRTLPARFISEFFGSGVQHVAFSCRDIFQTVAAMRQRGAAFLEIPENYYDDLEAKYDLAPEVMAKLRASRILYDRDGEAEFFQVYTHIFDERFFFEIVERKIYQGFGAANAAIRLAAQAREVRPMSMPRV